MRTEGRKAENYVPPLFFEKAGDKKLEKKAGFGSWLKVPGQTCHTLPLLENRRSQSMHVFYRERKAKLPIILLGYPLEIQDNPNIQMPLLKLAYRSLTCPYLP